MNLDHARIVLRPRSLAEVLDLSFRVCFSRAFSLYLRLSAIFLLPSFALCLLLYHLLEWDALSVWLIAFVLAGLFQGVFTVAAGKLIFAEELTAGEVLRDFRGRLGSYIGALVLSRLYIAMSAVFIITLPIVWTPLCFVHEACLLEMASAGEAPRRSWRFAAGNSSLAFMVLVSLLLGQGAGVVAAEMIGQAIVTDVFQLGTPFGTLTEAYISPYALFGFFISVPVVATARFLSYIDIRTRTDGWDIQLKFMAIAARELQRMGWSP